MSQTKHRALQAAVGIVSLSILLIALPSAFKPEFIPGFLRKPTLHLGLDLAGGTQLDYRVSEAEMEKQIAQLEEEIADLKLREESEEGIADRQAQIQSIEAFRRTIVEALRTVLERRINSLGVSEAQITPAVFGSEKHLLVECPGVVDTQKCIETVGKTVALEFKEQFTETDDALRERTRERAEAVERAITGSGRTIADVQFDFQDELGVQLISRSFFRDDLPDGLQDIFEAEEGELLKREGSYGFANRGTGEHPDIVANEGIFIAAATGPLSATGRVISGVTKVFEAMDRESETATSVLYEELPLADFEDALRQLIPRLSIQSLTGALLSSRDARLLYLSSRRKGEVSMEASHILLIYSGSPGAPENYTRTKEQARALAEEVRRRLDQGETFEELVKKYSGDAQTAERGGSLGEFSRGKMVAPFEEAAFALKEGEISQPVESGFGYHIIRSDRAPEVQPDAFTLYELRFTGAKAAETLQTLYEDAKDLRIERIADTRRVEGLFFSSLPTGWKDTPLDGKRFRRATVVSDPVTALPVVQIVFDAEGGELFYDLTKRNVGKPIAIFVGGDLVSAPTVQDEIPGGVAVITGIGTFQDAQQLSNDLNTGAIPAPIHLVGQVTVEPTLGKEDLISSIKAGVVGFLLIALYMILFYRVLGFLAIISLSCYVILFTALLKLPVFLFTDQYIVLTLAGVAGFLMTIGMALDANVLIFERVKEELAKEKLFKTAVDIGFRRAWAAIWDSNVTTLLTAVILFIIGTSIVRGFAVTLSLGIPLSMFTAITITRKLIEKLEGTPLKENMAALGVRKGKAGS